MFPTNEHGTSKMQTSLGFRERLHRKTDQYTSSNATVECTIELAAVSLVLNECRGFFHVTQAMFANLRTTREKVLQTRSPSLTNKLPRAVAHHPNRPLRIALARQDAQPRNVFTAHVAIFVQNQREVINLTDDASLVTRPFSTHAHHHPSS